MTRTTYTKHKKRRQRTKGKAPEWFDYAKRDESILELADEIREALEGNAESGYVCDMAERLSNLIFQAAGICSLS